LGNIFLHLDSGLLTDTREFVPIDCVKFSLPLILALIAITLALNACTTLANRRDLYSPAPVQGPYTDQLANHQVADTVAKNPAPPKNH
jgi:hypothetical protein